MNRRRNGCVRTETFSLFLCATHWSPLVLFASLCHLLVARQVFQLAIAGGLSSTLGLVPSATRKSIEKPGDLWTM